MKNYVEKNIGDIFMMEKERDKAIDLYHSERGRTVALAAGRAYRLNDEEVEKLVEDVKKEYESKIVLVENAVEKKIAEAMKKNIQELEKVDCLPSADTKAGVEYVIQEYNSNKTGIAEQDKKNFIDSLKYHLDNETVKAETYYLAYKELFPGEDASQYLLQLKPEYKELDEQRTKLNEASDLWEQYKINKQASVPGLGTLERISLKRRMYNHGGNPNSLEFAE